MRREQTQSCRHGNTLAGGHEGSWSEDGRVPGREDAPEGQWEGSVLFSLDFGESVAQRRIFHWEGSCATLSMTSFKSQIPEQG